MLNLLIRVGLIFNCFVISSQLVTIHTPRLGLHMHNLKAGNIQDGVATNMNSETDITIDDNNVIPYMKEDDLEVTSKSLFGVRPIGIVRSPYMRRLNTPKQPTIERNGTKDTGYIEIFQEYRECMDQLDTFDNIWVITYMHLNSGYKSKIKPMPNPELMKHSTSGRTPPEWVGLFCSRAPHRPNPIALSVLKIVHINMDKGIIEVDGLDLLNGTPVLDVKPYIPAFDSFPSSRAGWMDDICSDIELCRQLGYQSITSSRGARATRAGDKKRKKAKESLDTVVNNEEHSSSSSQQQQQQQQQQQ